MPKVSVKCQICQARKTIDTDREGGDVFQLFFPDENILWLCSKCFGSVDRLEGVQVVGYEVK